MTVTRSLDTGGYISNLAGLGAGSYSTFESSSASNYGGEGELGGLYSVSTGNVGSYGTDANVVGGGYYSSASSSASFAETANGFQASSSDFDAAAYGQSSATNSAFVNASDSSSNNLGQQSTSTLTTSYPTDAQGIYQDPNPQIIRRPAVEGSKRYVQRVIVKFLQPPPLPPPGVNSSHIHALI